MASKPTRPVLAAYLQIAQNSLDAVRFAPTHECVGRNVAELIEVPEGKTGLPSKSLTLAQASGC